MGNYFTYITTNSTKSVLYTGMTNDLELRIIEHYLSRGKPDTFAGRYYCYYLVWYERYDRPIHAIEREKEVKKFSRKRKEDLINSFNPDWRFLNADILGKWPPDPDVVSRGK